MNYYKCVQCSGDVPCYIVVSEEKPVGCPWRDTGGAKPTWEELPCAPMLHKPNTYVCPRAYCNGARECELSVCATVNIPHKCLYVPTIDGKRVLWELQPNAMGPQSELI